LFYFRREYRAFKAKLPNKRGRHVEEARSCRRRNNPVYGLLTQQAVAPFFDDPAAA
jgi:hypothetical protein